MVVETAAWSFRSCSLRRELVVSIRWVSVLVRELWEFKEDWEKEWRRESAESEEVVTMCWCDVLLLEKGGTTFPLICRGVKPFGTRLVFLRGVGSSVELIREGWWGVFDEDDGGVGSGAVVLLNG